MRNNHVMSSEPARPSPESSSAIREAINRVRADSEDIDKWFADYCTQHSTRWAFDLDLIKQRVRHSSRLIELGCIPPVLTIALQRLGYHIEGVDIDPARFGSTIRDLGLRISRCNIETEPLPWAEKEFNGAVLNEVFEHLWINLNFTLAEILRVLKPGGKLFLSTPNGKSIHRLREFLIEKDTFSGARDIFEQYRKLEHLGHMGHVREYFFEELRVFLQKIGYQVSEVIYRGSYSSRRWDLPTRLLPQLRPMMTIVASRPEDIPDA